MTQWGSKYLGDQGKTPYEILTYFYGDNINLTTAPKVNGIPKSYPGASLTIGSTGEAVKTIQSQLNDIAKAFPLIPKVAVDGIYNQATANSVKVFQENFNLSNTGIVDYATWYRISDIYVGVTKIAELRCYDGNSKRYLFRQLYQPMRMIYQKYLIIYRVILRRKLYGKRFFKNRMF